MKRILITASIIMTIIVLSCFLVSCTEYKTGIQSVDLDAITQEVSNSVEIPMSTDLDKQTLQELFNLTPDDVRKYSGVFSMTMTSADTVVGILAKDGDTATIKNAYNNRIADIENSFIKNIDSEYKKVKNAKIIVKGDYVFLVISDNYKEVQNIINKYF
jgi:hypothetical protein